MIMKHSNRWNFILCLFPIIGTLANAQTITTYHSAFGIPAVTSTYLAVDIAVTDQIANPNYRPLYRSFQAPSLIDTQFKLGVAITGTIAQAEADLAAIKAVQIPAIEREKGKDVKAEAKSAASGAASANSVPALRAQVARLAELVEQLQERVEQLESKP